jgi:hypothetical protein
MYMSNGANNIILPDPGIAIGTGPFTLEYWINNREQNVNQDMFFPVTATNSGIWARHSNQNRTDYYLGNGSGTTQYIFGGTVYSDLAVWRYYVLMRDASGGLHSWAQGTKSGTTYSGTNFNLTSQPYRVGHQMNGMIAGIRLTKTAVYSDLPSVIPVPTAPFSSIPDTLFLWHPNRDMTTNYQNRANGANAGQTNTVFFSAHSPFTKNTDWTVVDSQTNITNWASPQVEKTFTLASPASFKYYRLVVTAIGNVQATNNYVALAEIKPRLLVNNSGGSGAFIKGTLAVNPGETYTIAVGQRTSSSTSTGSFGSSLANGSPGGGYSALFKGPPIIQNLVCLAAGAGGAGLTGHGGAGGLTTGSAGNPGGSGGSSSTSEYFLVGGTSSSGGGGGGGYYGGNPGTSGSGGGGGSSYIGLLTSTSSEAGKTPTSSGEVVTPGGTTDPAYNAAKGSNNQDGYVSLTETSGSALVEITSEVSFLA